MRTQKRIALIRTPEHTVADVDLENRIARFLHQRHVPNCTRIKAHAHGGTVVVSGKLPSRQAERLCIECCRHVAGVIKLIDNLEVKTEPVRKRTRRRVSERSEAK